MRLITNIIKAFFLLFAGLFIFFMLKMDKPGAVNYPSGQASSVEIQSISAAIGTLCALVLLSIMLLVCLAYSRNKVD